MTLPSLVDLKAAYSRNENITRLLRQAGAKPTNDPSAILIAYDLQAGSYVRACENPTHLDSLRVYAEAIAAVLARLQPTSLLEPGVGEATTLVEVVNRLSLPKNAPILGFDLSWSRVHVARQYLAQQGVEARLFVGELESIPLPENAVDVVYTAHAIEPNHGREKEILRELYRVAGRYLVLFEPSYELASDEARARMQSHGYCRGLAQIAGSFGWNVIEHRLLGAAMNPLNPTGVLVIEKSQTTAWPVQAPKFHCPSCHGELNAQHGAYFCPAEGLVYPVLRDIACLARHNSTLANRFLD
jgi:hypothetical protein